MDAETRPGGGATFPNGDGFARVGPPCYAAHMDAIAPWITPALVIALGAWLRVDLRDLRREMNDLRRGMNDLAGSMNKRFDQVNRELADLRERMAKLEGSLEGFLAGRRDRDAA